MDLTQAQGWASLVPAIAVALLLLLVPGATLSRALGLRGMHALGPAPAISTSVIAISAVVTPWLGMRWSIWCVALGWAVALALTLLLRWPVDRSVRRRAAADAAPSQASTPEPGASTSSGAVAPTHPPVSASAAAAARDRTGLLTGVVALAIAALLLGSTFLRLVPDSEYIMQLFDNVFHLNAVRAILDSGDGSSLTLWGITNKPDNTSFYPAAWHDLVALVAQIAGIGVPQAVNVLALVVIAMVWPLGVIWLGQVIGGPNARASLAAGLLSACFPAFPWLFLHWGPLYPNLLGNSLIAALLAVTVLAFDRRPRTWRMRLTALPAALLIAPGIALGHPNALLAATGLGLMVVLTTAVPQLCALRRAARRGAAPSGVLAGTIVSRLGTRRAWTLVGTITVITVGLWGLARTGLAVAPWQADEGLWESAWDLVTNGPVDRPRAWAVSVLAAVGAIVTVHRRRWWPLAVFGLVAVLYLVVSDVPVAWLRDALTGGFYRDPKRIAGLTVLGYLPLAAIGLQTLWTLLLTGTRRLGRRAAARSGRAGRMARRTLGRILALALAAAIVVPIRIGPIDQVIAWAQRDYVIADTSKLLDRDERDVLAHLHDYVPADQTLLVDPGNGGALAYAFENYRVTRVHILSGVSDDLHVLDWHLSDPAWMDQTCPIVRAHDLHYTLDFGAALVDSVYKPGLSGIPAEVGTTVYQQGEARLVELTGCWDGEDDGED